jgi:excinuclease ABC subunit C
MGNDDFRAMEEVVGRRYWRLSIEGKPFPDLVVIDGGAGQVGAALKAFVSLGLEPPALVGLAKREETVVFPDGRAPLDMPLDHPGLRLLQRLRDEAHRFANTYNADLRSKKIRESLLDDFPGLGPVRRAALMEWFGSIDRLKDATAESVAEVPGFGQRMAADLHAFLAGKRSPTQKTP